MWFDWKPIPEVDLDIFRELCPDREYRVLPTDQFPAGIFSDSLLAKTHSILVTASGTESGRVYMMCNLNREDKTEIDQMPYGIAIEGHDTLPSGILIQHGDYHDDRTTQLPKDFYEFVSVSGTYPLKTMPSSNSGKLNELKIGSQREAFDLLIKEIRAKFPETKCG